MKKEFNEVENKQSWSKLETEGYNVISAIYGISHAECVQMVSATDAKLTAVL